MSATRIAPSARRVQPDLGLWRINLMRGGYLLMTVGLALVKWPLLGQAASLPLFEGVTLALLTAMSLLAMLGLFHPVKLLPVLLFETTWKVLWLGLVALPNALSGDLSAAMTDIVISCSVVVVIIAVTPWRYVWRSYGSGKAEQWR
jgi:hypothetical protein